MKIRLIASDIDGTLLPIGARVFSPATLAIAEGCRKRDIFFTVSSGRLIPGAMHAAVELGITCPLITSNGGILADPSGRAIREFLLGRDAAREISDTLLGNGLSSACYCRTGFIQMNPGGGSVLTLDESYGGFPFVRSVNDRARYEDEGFELACKMETYSDDRALLLRVGQTLREKGFSVSQAFPNNLEILAPGCGKGRALASLAAYLGVDIRETMAMGDNTNDIDMLRAAGLSVAMGNAVQCLKDAADVIACDCADDGAAKAVAKYAWEESC